jgi:hypothetical protein
LASSSSLYHSSPYIPSLLSHGLKESLQIGGSMKGLGWHSKVWVSQPKIQNPKDPSTSIQVILCSNPINFLGNLTFSYIVGFSSYILRYFLKASIRKENLKDR